MEWDWLTGKYPTKPEKMKIVFWGRVRWLGPSGRERTRQGRVVKMPTSREAEC